MARLDRVTTSSRTSHAQLRAKVEEGRHGLKVKLHVSLRVLLCSGFGVCKSKVASAVRAARWICRCRPPPDEAHQ